jgi:hypothetical protein
MKSRSACATDDASSVTSLAFSWLPACAARNAPGCHGNAGSAATTHAAKSAMRG